MVVNSTFTNISVISWPGADLRRRRPPKIGKNMIFWRKIMIFHTKYPKNVRASHRSARFFLSAPPLLLEILDPPLMAVSFIG